MLRRFLLAFVSLAAAAPAAALPRNLGIFGLWGAFRDDDRCYAIAEPEHAPDPQGWRPFVAVGRWPARHLGGQLFVRLSREKREGSAVLLRIDGRSYQLSGRGRDAWAPATDADEEILTAMRTGVDMTVETRASDGALVRDEYALHGAATAMDAAAIACLPRR